MNRAFLILLSLGALCSPAPADSLTTTAGKSYEGTLELADRNVLGMTTEDGKTVEVQLGELESVRRIAAPEPARKNPDADSPILIRATGVVTTNGSFIAREVRSLDGQSVEFDTEVPGLVLTISNVSAIIFRPLTPTDAGILTLERPGVLLRSGDFMEGTFRSLRGGQVAIDSLLFGRQSFSTAHDAAAVILRPAVFDDSEFSIQTGSGSCYRAKRVGIRGGKLVLDGSPFHEMAIDPDEPFELRREQARSILRLYQARWNAAERDGQPADHDRARGIREEIANTADPELKRRLQHTAQTLEDLDLQELVVKEARRQWLELLETASNRGKSVLAAERERVRTQREARSADESARRSRRAADRIEEDLAKWQMQLEKAKAQVGAAREQASRAAEEGEPDHAASAARLQEAASRELQEMHRAWQEARDRHQQELKRYEALDKKGQAADTLAKQAREEEDQLRREADDLRQERDQAKRVLDTEHAKLRALTEELSRWRAEVRERREVLERNP